MVLINIKILSIEDNRLRVDGSSALFFWMTPMVSRLLLRRGLVSMSRHNAAVGEQC
jgi:hypothetical protein